MKTSIAISSLLGIAALLSSLRPNGETAPVPQYDLLIRNGQVIDGTGRRGYAADVAIKGDRIVRIGKLPKARARRVIDARGLVVAPGFIKLRRPPQLHLVLAPPAVI